MRCMRAYLEHDMHLALEVHTEQTITSGRAWLAQFSDLIDVSASPWHSGLMLILP